MLALVQNILRDPVPYHGGLGLFALVTIEKLNSFVGLLVGLATLVYLCLRIREAVRKHGKSRSGRSGSDSDEV